MTKHYDVIMVELKSWIFVIIIDAWTNGSKFEPRKQMNRALTPGDIRILNLSRTILQCLCCPNFYFKYFFNLLRRTL